MKKAIEHYEAALKEAFPRGASGDVFHHWNEARKALEQPAQDEPFGYFRYDMRLDAWVQNREGRPGTPFYTRPANSMNSTKSSKMLDAQAREPLTAKEISLLWKRHTNEDGPHFLPYEDDGLGFARAIEAAHGIKGKA